MWYFLCKHLVQQDNKINKHEAGLGFKWCLTQPGTFGTQTENRKNVNMVIFSSCLKIYQFSLNLYSKAHTQRLPSVSCNISYYFRLGEYYMVSRFENQTYSRNEFQPNKNSSMQTLVILLNGTHWRNNVINQYTIHLSVSMLFAQILPSVYKQIAYYGI